MGFQAITEHYQDQINEQSKRIVSEALIEDIERILEEYCHEIEETYGVTMLFDIRVAEEDGRLRYRVTPDSELDNMLLSQIVENEAQIGPVSFTLQ